MSDHVELYLDDAGEYRWRRKAANGEIVATSEGYTRKADAERSARDNFPEDEIEDTSEEDPDMQLLKMKC
jgi:hypothetical protein